MIDFTVIPDDGDRYDVKATARDVLVWEKTSKGRSFTQMMAELPLKDLYRIAWIASRRKGHFDGTAEAFETTCDLVFEGEDEAAADPTPPAA